jgi:hypothetical protein
VTVLPRVTVGALDVVGPSVYREPHSACEHRRSSTPQSSQLLQATWATTAARQLDWRPLQWQPHHPRWMLLSLPLSLLLLLLLLLLEPHGVCCLMQT